MSRSPHSTAGGGSSCGSTTAGPFAQGRIIDLSRTAAEALGIKAQGHAAVRVRRVEPSEKDRKRLREGKAAAPLAPVTGQELLRLRVRIPAKGR